MNGPALEVSAGLIFRAGRLLITQRPAGKHLAGLWEFPGGKREPGESWEACLERELQEELGVRVEVGRLFDEVVHEYLGKRVHLRFFSCGLLVGEPAPMGCAAVKWVTAADRAAHEFPPADAHLLAALPSAPEFAEKRF
jgi:mutator protein MutT